MKESRLMIIVSGGLSVLCIIYYILNQLCSSLSNYNSIVTNLFCGIIVALVTSICEYWSARRKIINNIYNAYFDVYRTYYYSKNNTIFFHYNSHSIYKKMIELNPKIVEFLDEYHGLFKKYTKTYRKLNPIIQFGDNYKATNMIKSYLLWFNKKSFTGVFEPLMNQVENILINIDEKRFEKDKIEMIKMFNYIWNKRK